MTDSSHDDNIGPLLAAILAKCCQKYWANIAGKYWAYFGCDIGKMLPNILGQ